jgi:hypothetical protein
MQVQARADADLKNQTSRRFDYPLAIMVRHGFRVARSSRRNPAFVNAHYRHPTQLQVSLHKMTVPC